MKNLLKDIGDGFSHLIALFMVIIIIVLLPIIIVVILLVWACRELWIRVLLIKHNGKIYFVYADYNHIEFSGFTIENHKDVIPVKVVNNYAGGLIKDYLIRRCHTKAYPRLIKIKNARLIHRVHFGTYKNMVKRKGDLEGFHELLDRSIAKLRKTKLEDEVWKSI
ncbi:hypothetical protein POV27_02510 [Aureisphaera galaxeae]|uniref:hypothetical protein n=1 Tax=Aureisphaera galaxeae TaxID=1538023 RepID=UPI002350230B|nr:hypothetical protein [Aureisphaera galaxeae]MDC8002914.1 hypothetical protein [Aureisphaera galaxeae]